MSNSRHDDLALFADPVRDAYLAPPDEETEARHLAAMAEEARVVPHEAAAARPRAHRTKEAFVTRFRNAALAVKLAALTVVAALATGGLATAGVISLPEPLPGVASDDAKTVHEAIDVDGSDPSEERCAFGQRVAEAASDGTSDAEACDAAETADQGAERRGASGKVEARQNGADPEDGAGQAFGESVSDHATGGELDEPGTEQAGKEFGESISDEAEELVPRPSPQPEGGVETGESNSQLGQQTGESFSEGGRDIAESHGDPLQD